MCLAQVSHHLSGTTGLTRPHGPRTLQALLPPAGSGACFFLLSLPSSLSLSSRVHHQTCLSFQIFSLLFICFV